MTFNLSLMLFALASTATPGPNNLMMLSSGLNFGLQRSVPHWLGICTGVPVMVILLGFGLEQLFLLWPMLYTIIKAIGIAYLLFLAYKIAVTHVSENEASTSKPLTFIQGALFQWVNPKAWVMGVGAIAAFTVQDATLLPQVLTIALTSMSIGLISVGSWLFAGSYLKKLLKNDRQQRIFNIAMGVLLAASVVPMIIM